MAYGSYSKLPVGRLTFASSANTSDMQTVRARETFLVIELQWVFPDRVNYYGY